MNSDRDIKTGIISSSAKVLVAPDSIAIVVVDGVGPVLDEEAIKEDATQVSKSALHT